MDELLEVIKNEVEARELSESMKIFDSKPLDHQKRLPPPTAAALLVQEDKSKRKMQCVYCKAEHFSASCEKVKTVPARVVVLKREGRCFLCLSSGHRVAECSVNRRCRKCGRKHHQSLCEQTVPVDPPKETVAAQEGSDKDTVKVTTVARCKNEVLLQTARTFAYTADDGLVPVRILMDVGSQRSYLSNELKSKLNLKPMKRENITVNTFGNEEFNKQKCDVIKVRLQAKHGKDVDVEITALSFPAICSPLQIPIQPQQYPHLQELDLADTSALEHFSNKVDMLIGSDYYWDVVIGDVKRGYGGPTAVSSKFGWLLSGPVTPENKSVHYDVSNLVIEGAESISDGSRDCDLSADLCRFWEAESIGIVEKPQEAFNNTSFVELKYDWTLGRYRVNLPWKTDFRPQNNGYEMSTARLNQLTNKLRKDEPLLQQYDATFKAQLQDGIIERAPSMQNQSGCHFLPHHGVVKTNRETTKLRIVFDASAKASKTSLSLNDCLEKGPNGIPHIFNLLLNFRRHPIGLTADIEKAFHQIVIDPKDRDALRFLWIDDVSKPSPELVQYRFCRLVFGLTPSPAILTETIQYHLTRFLLKEPEMATLLSESFYVDDLICGVQDEEQGLRTYDKSRQLMASGGFNLRKWRTNSEPLQQKIDLTDTSIIPNDVTKVEGVKILGLTWDTKTDKFCFSFKDVLNYARSLPPTKRSVLKTSSKLFDPLGLLSPFIIKAKMLFQILCRGKVDWDQNLTEPSLTKWKHFTNDLEVIAQITVPRYYHVKELTPVTVELHGFSDASEKAYAAVVYLRSIYSDGTVSTCIMASKTRVAPIKGQTIPRLELLGATILSRLVNTILQSLSIRPQVYCWTDSLTVLCWIKNHRHWKQYVQIRVTEIRQLTEESWRFCPGSENPADIPSRSCGANELISNELWWNGPKFLRQDPEKWPDHPTKYECATASAELVKGSTAMIHSMVSVAENGEASLNLEDIMDLRRWNSKLKLLRVTATVLKFIHLLKSKDRAKVSKDLMSDELREAECLWIRSIQRKCFPEEHKQLQKDKVIVYKRQFQLFFNDQKLICGKGHLGNANLPMPMKSPVLLPTKHHFTELLIRECHKLVHHNGISETLTCLRQNYWIFRGREAVKRIVRQCTICRRYKGKPYSGPLVPDLPTERVSEDPPFNNTGIDFAGPLYVRDGGRTDSKAYICLFTCASTRALHLEVTDGMTAATFLLAFRRFCSRRGVPSLVMSDNAKTFKHCAKEVIKVVRSEEVRQHMTNKQIQWIFIAEKAPWWGGYWERMVRSVKRCLRKVVGNSTLIFDELVTTVVEIEATLNNRPLTYVHDDEEGVSYVLTPASLVYGRRLATTPSGRQFEVSSTNKTLTKRAKHQFRVLSNFTRQWQRDYLLSLQERRSVKLSANSNDNARKVKVGDIVILKEEGTARCLWKLAKVTETLEGRDGKIRSAKIQVLSKEKVIQLRRPIQHLVPLEADI